MARLLIVDDSATVRQVITRILESDGHEVITGEDGIDAVWLYKHEQPDGVLLDLEMPLLNGLEALAKIMQIDSHARVALLTSETRPEVVFAAKAAGAVDFVGKPYESGRIARAVETLLAA